MYLILQKNIKKIYIIPSNSCRVIRRLANNSLLALLISNISNACLGTPSPSMWKSMLNCGLGIAGSNRDLAMVLPPLADDMILSGLVHLEIFGLIIESASGHLFTRAM